MDVETIRSFLAVAKHRSISKAAASLYVTQPAMSQRLRRLEDSLGFPLLARDWSGVSLTRQGRYFLPYAAQLVRDLSNAAEVLGRSGEPKPRSFAEVADQRPDVVIGVDDWLPGTAIAAVVQSALTRLSLEDFRVTVRPAPTVTDLLNLNQLDAALFYAAETDYPFRTDILGVEDMVLMHAQDVELADQTPEALREIFARYPFVLFDNPVLTHHAAITSVLIHTYDIFRFHVVDDYRTMVSLVGLADCVTVVPAGTVAALGGLAPSGLSVTSLHGLVPQINLTLGLSDTGVGKGLVEFLPQEVAGFLEK